MIFFFTITLFHEIGHVLRDRDNNLHPRLVTLIGILQTFGVDLVELI